jgi:hypothetical protein
MPLVIHAEIAAVGVSTTQSAQIQRDVDAGCPHNTKTGKSGGQTHSMGRVIATVDGHVYVRNKAYSNKLHDGSNSLGVFLTRTNCCTASGAPFVR